MTFHCYPSDSYSSKAIRFSAYSLLLLCLVFMNSCHTHKKALGINENSNERIERPHREHDKYSDHPVIAEAYTWLGTPYKYAGQEKGVGTDCSGMVMMVYEVSTGEKLPRNSAKQAEYCDKIKAEEVTVGDLVFFATGKDANKVSHVGIMVEKDSFIHASSSRGVIISDLNSSYYKRTFMMFGRVPRRNGLITDNK